MWVSRVFPAVCFLIGMTGVVSPAHGQVITRNETAFSVERFAPSPGAATYWAAEDGDVLPHLSLALAATGSLMTRPLVLSNLFTDDQPTTPVRTRLGFDLMAAVGFFDRFQLGVALPVVAAQEGDRLQGIDLDERSLEPIAFGDVRLHGKMRFLGRLGGYGPSVALSLAMTLTTGDSMHFAGEKGSVFEPRLIGAWKFPRGSLAVNLGARLRRESVVLLSPARPHGNELVMAIAGEFIVPGLARDHLTAVAEYTRVRGGSAAMSNVRGPSPREFRFGGRWRLRNGTAVGAAVGRGTSPDEVGSPNWRVMATVHYNTKPASDLDRDGVVDARDACRLVPEDRDGFLDSDGCPDPDNDGDTVLDEDDECPTQREDLDQFQDLDGCPE